jgi:hypothetical protein
MFKKFTIAVLFIPAFAYAQVDGSAGIGAIGFLIGLGICLIVFLALRQVVLWYWKIETLIKNQEAQLKAQQANNHLLAEYIDYLKSKDTI